MTPSPRPLTAEELREVRDASRRSAVAMSGLGVALFGMALAALTMIAIVVLDYRFHQPLHRVVKMLGAGALGLGVVMMPWTGLLAFPVILPYLVWIPPIPIPGMNATNLLLGVVFCSFAVQRIISHQPLGRSSRVGGAIAMMLVLLVLGVIRGAAFPAGFYYNPMLNSLTAFRGAQSMAVFFVALLMVRGEKARRAALWAVLVGIAAESVTTLMLGRSGKGMRAVGSLGQANELGAFMAIGTGIAVAMAPAIKAWWGKLLVLGIGLAAGMGVILSLSRAAFIAVLLAVGYATVRTSRTLTLVLLAVLATSPFWAPDYLKDRVTGSYVESEGSDDVSLDNASQLRIDTWHAIFKIVGDHPFDGVGFGAVAEVLPASADALGVDAADSSHNTFLRLLAETGIIGLALFVFLWWSCFSLSLAATTAARTKFDRQVGIALGSATMAYATCCAFGDRFFVITISGGFWILCALGEDILHEAARPPLPSPVLAKVEEPA